MNKTIGIAGAGLMGRLLGWRLKELGYQVTVFDRDISGHSSAAFAAAGMLSPFAESVVSQELIYQLGMDSLALWPQWTTEIASNFTINQHGSIIGCHHYDENELKHFIQRLVADVDRHAIIPLDRQAIAALEPELHFSKGFHLTQEGLIDTRLFISTLTDYFIKTNTPLIEQNVLSVMPRRIQTEHHSYLFDAVFDCRGRGGEQHFDDLRSVRGEVIRVYAPDVTLQHTIRLTHPRYPIYIAPMANHHYVIGATEIEVDDTSPISVRSCLELLNAAYSVHRGFAEARIIDTCTAQRPTLYDNLPRILHQDGFIAVNGLYRHGFLIAPALVNTCVNLITSQPIDPTYPNLIKECHYAD